MAAVPNGRLEAVVGGNAGFAEVRLTLISDADRKKLLASWRICLNILGSSPRNTNILSEVVLL